MAINKHFAVAAGLCGGLGLGAWDFYFRALTGVRGEDWMVYYTAIRMYFEGRLQALYDGTALTGLLNERFARFLAHPLPLHPWLYPPHYLVLLLPFGWLPPVAAGVLFLGASFAALAAAVLGFFADRRRRMIGLLMIALCPATALTVYLGQNTFFTCALLVGGLGLLRRRPWLAGVLLGMLTYKPQFCLMVPVALAADRQWKSMGAAAATVLALVAASVALFGLEPWRDWIRLLVAPNALYETWDALVRLKGQSVYSYAMLLGAAPIVANALQAGAVLFAGAAVWRCHRSDLAPERKIAVLLAATILSAPHVIDYDALMLGLAATLLLLRSLDEELGVSETLLLALLWLSPLYNPPSVWPLAYATVPLLLTFILWTMRGAATRRGYGYSPATDGSRY